MKRLIFLFSIFILVFLTGCVKNGSESGNDENVGADMLTLPYSYESWMSKISDDTSIADISIPGTHDSGAFDSDTGAFENNWVLAQSHNIENQLKLGVRWFDIRVRAQKSDDGYYLGVYHGHFYLNLSFYSVLKSAKDFLEKHPTETVAIMIKQEHSSLNSTDFSKEIYKKLKEIGIDKFYLEEDVLPLMKNVRGKIIIFRRFERGKLEHKMGYYLYWPDQTKGSSHHHNNYHFYVQDYYHVNPDTYSKKVKYAEDAMYKALDEGENGKLYLNYTSCYATYHYNKTVASHINPSVDSYAKDLYHWGKAGVILINFAGTGNSDGYKLIPHFVKHIIEINYEL